MIRGRGADSAVPNDETAVDADVYLCGFEIGSVTLRADPYSRLVSAWGDPEHWASDRLLAFVGRDMLPAVADAIGRLVRAEA